MTHPSPTPILATLAGVVLTMASCVLYAKAQVCAQQTTTAGRVCKDPGSRCTAGSLAGTCKTVPTLGCLCNFSEPVGSYSLTATPLSPASVSPGGTVTSTLTVTPSGEYTGSILLSCSSASPTAQLSCGFSPNPVPIIRPALHPGPRPPVGAGAPLSRSVILTATAPAQTAMGSYTFTVEAVDANNMKPTGNPLNLTLNVVKGQPVTYTEVINGASGTLGSIAFGTPAAIPHAKLTLTFTGNTDSIVPFSIPPAPQLAGTDFATITGYQNLTGTASLQIDDADKNQPVANATFLPGSGIFVYVDNERNLMGFGSGGLPPTSPAFPLLVSWTFPYVAQSPPTTDLMSNFSSGQLMGFSCAGAGDCLLGIRGISPVTALPTSAGMLSLATDVFSSTATFSVSTTPNPGSYTVSVGGWDANPIPRGTGVVATTTVTRSPGYNGTVTLSCLVGSNTWDGTALPGCSFTPPILPPGSTTAILNVIVSNQAPVPKLAFPVSYTVFVDARDGNDFPPSNGMQTPPAIGIAESSGGGFLALSIFLLLLLGRAMTMMMSRKRASN